MQIVTLDFETFYAKGYGLRKYTTEEYILHPQFQVIGVAIQIDNGKPVWLSLIHISEPTRPY